MKKTHRGKKSNFKINHSTWWFFVVAVSIFIGLAIPTQTLAVGLVVEGVSSNGDTSPLTSYRWLIEEDTTHYVDPGVRVNNPPSVQFHTSYTPVVAKGDESDSLPALDPNKRYFISVLPKEAETYSIGGAPFNGSDASVTVYLNALPLPTAQITVFIFEDNRPINNAPDIPEEAGLSGFQIKLEDAGGRWGDSAGEQMTDAFGNMLGTLYDNNGTVIGYSPLITAADGKLTIKNLAPGKYGVTAVPPAGEGWQQTSTIEGKRVIDAWVKAGEPPYFVEFGQGLPGVHVFV
ncbi:MAG: hypothetical protein GY757_07325, partial [bacterium]|nr:hypothetical protein [bacterium]